MIIVYLERFGRNLARHFGMNQGRVDSDLDLHLDPFFLEHEV